MWCIITYIIIAEILDNEKKNKGISVYFSYNPNEIAPIYSTEIFKDENIQVYFTLIFKDNPRRHSILILKLKIVSLNSELHLIPFRKM